MAAEIAKNLLQVFPLTLNFSAWYLGRELFALGMRRYEPSHGCNNGRARPPKHVRRWRGGGFTLTI